MRAINTHEEYASAKEELKELFNADTCNTDSKSAHELMRALDTWEAKCIKLTCTKEHDYLNQV